MLGFCFISYFEPSPFASRSGEYTFISNIEAFICFSLPDPPVMFQQRGFKKAYMRKEDITGLDGNGKKNTIKSH